MATKLKAFIFVVISLFIVISHIHREREFERKITEMEAETTKIELAILELELAILELEFVISVCEKHDGLKWFNKREIRCYDGTAIDRVASGIGL